LSSAKRDTAPAVKIPNMSQVLVITHTFAL
jgi:hypothetical protein